LLVDVGEYPPVPSSDTTAAGKKQEKNAYVSE